MDGTRTGTLEKIKTYRANLPERGSYTQTGLGFRVKLSQVEAPRGVLRCSGGRVSGGNYLHTDAKSPKFQGWVAEIPRPGICEHLRTAEMTNEFLGYYIIYRLSGAQVMR